MSQAPALPVFRTYAGMAAAFRAMKDHIGLSNEDLERLCGFCAGHSDKMLGPSSTKTIGRLSFDTLCTALAIEFVPRIDIEAARRMESRWEKRNRSQIRVDAKPPSIDILERAKPVIFRINGVRGALARNEKLSPTKRKRIAKNAARARWRQSAAVRANARKRRGQAVAAE